MRVRDDDGGDEDSNHWRKEARKEYKTESKKKNINRKWRQTNEKIQVEGRVQHNTAVYS